MPKDYDSLHDDWTMGALKSLEERPPSDGLYLAKSTGEYILRDKDEKKSKEDNIEEVASALPKRLTRLLYDIALLDSGGYLNNLDQNWERLEQVPRHLKYKAPYLHERNPATTNTSFYYDLGISVGLGMSALTGTLSEDTRGSEFFSGFTKAYSTDHVEEEYGTSGYTITWPPEAVSEIEEVCEQYGAEASVTIHRYICRLTSNDKSLEQRARVFFEEFVGDRFGNCILMRNCLDEEWESIGDASSKGMYADEILTTLYNSDQSTATSSNIATEIESGSHEKLVTQVLNRLSTNGKDPSQQATTTFKHSEIVQYNHNEQHWELTDYGTLLLYDKIEEISSMIQYRGLQFDLHGYDRNPQKGEKILKEGINDLLEE